MLFGDLTYEEIRQAAADAASVVVIPTGCTEQQGPHLTVDFDTWLVSRVSLAGAQWAAEHNDVTALVLPALPFGPTPEHRSFGSGFIDVPQQVHEKMVAAILRSLLDQGFRRLLIWRGCGQHDLRAVTERFNAEHRGVLVREPALPYADIWESAGDPSVVGGHADSFATALALFLRPDNMRQDRVRDSHSKPVPWGESDLDFGRYSTSGVIGDPTHATAELGARLWAQIVPRVGEEIVRTSTMSFR